MGTAGLLVRTSTTPGVPDLGSALCTAISDRYLDHDSAHTFTLGKEPVPSWFPPPAPLSSAPPLGFLLLSAFFARSSHSPSYCLLIRFCILITFDTLKVLAQHSLFGNSCLWRSIEHAIAVESQYTNTHATAPVVTVVTVNR